MEGADLIGLACHPALDFLNSTGISGRNRIELLGDGQAYLTWLTHELLVDARDVDAVADRFSTTELDRAAVEAVALREWLRPVVAAWAGASAGPVLPQRVCDHLNEILATDHQYMQLDGASDGPPALRTRRHWTQSRQLLVPPAEAAAQLLNACDRNLVRNCEGHACTLWFFDQAKSHRRRWCSMAVCGNREKSRNHRARERSHDLAAEPAQASAWVSRQGETGCPAPEPVGVLAGKDENASGVKGRRLPAASSQRPSSRPKRGGGELASPSPRS
jgi:predicted RNA-binding Zn ribbon-like protein